MLIFVYGTLLSNLPNSYLLKGSTLVKKGRTLPSYKMISLGGYPGVLKGGTDSIVGEVWEVSSPTLERLDRLEGHPEWYRRTPIVLEDGTNCEIYIYPDKKTAGFPVVPNGDWRNFKGGRY